MNLIEIEIKKRLKNYKYKLAKLHDSYMFNEMDAKEYLVEYEKLQEKIKLLET
tara:strand:+ start:80 stop:238 length:159 start_codon:yes stop_codon:yes gene_type:complete